MTDTNTTKILDIRRTLEGNVPYICDFISFSDESLVGNLSYPEQIVQLIVDEIRKNYYEERKQCLDD